MWDFLDYDDKDDDKYTVDYDSFLAVTPETNASTAMPRPNTTALPRPTRRHLADKVHALIAWFRHSK